MWLSAQECRIRIDRGRVSWLDFNCGVGGYLMNLKMRLCSLALPLAAALVAGTNVAFAATTFTYNGYSVADEQNIQILTPNNVYGGAGQITLNGSGTNVGQHILAWCLDIYDYLQGSGSYQMGPLTTAGSGSPNPPLTTTQIGQIGSLIGHGNALVGSTHDVSAAVQLAIWELEYGSSFTFSGLSSGVTTLATTYLANVSGGSWSTPAYVVTLLSQTGNQNLAFVTPLPDPGPGGPTPLPGALPLFAAGLGIVGYLSNRRRKRLMRIAV